MRLTILAAAVGLLSIATAASAAEKMHDMKMDHSSSHMTGGMKMTSPADKAFDKAMKDMHKNMMIDYSGDADVDFVRGMIPHHQGAIDMARIELKYGKDAKLRELAQGIIAAQEREIAEMKAWLKKHGK